MESSYPWYALVQGDDIKQGDILEDCPVFFPSDTTSDDLSSATFEWEKRDVVVMSQSCDMAIGREKVTEVLLCAVWKRSELKEGHLATKKGLEDARRGLLHGFHVIAECSLTDWTREVRIVDFRRIYSLPIKLVRKRASIVGNRLRIMPPYREHLSQSFARFFMRVGLPVDIPPFK